MKLTTTLAIIVTAPLILAACASRGPTAIEVSTPQAKIAAPAPEPDARVLKVAPKYEIVLSRGVPTPLYLDPQNALFTERSFYFAINSSKVKAEFAKQLEMHGKFLAANPQIAITIEGSSDERGETDFNFALGKKRAAAIAKVLKSFGVADTQMEIVSLGRDQPKVTGHAEAAWSKNRRVDIVYPAK